MANGSIYYSDSTAAFAFDSAEAYSCDSIAAAGTPATLPADSAFLTGKLVTEPHSQTAAADRQSTDMYGDMIADGIIALMAAVFIIFMKGILNVMPMVLGSLFRWKENLNIEDSVKMCRERNRFALILFPAFCVTTARYGVWSPSFIGDSGLLTSIPVTAAALVVFLLVRGLLIKIMRPSGMNGKTWKAANDALYTYFITSAILVLATAGAMSFAGCTDHAVKMAIVYECAAVWLVFLFRKMQIFKNSCSLFSAILYLCTLEILPMAVLTVPAILP